MGGHSSVDGFRRWEVVRETVRGMDAAPGAPTDGFTAFSRATSQRRKPEQHAAAPHQPA
jgi:hypothetical protein